MSATRPASIIITALIVMTGSCVGSPCRAGMADSSPFDYGPPDALATSLLHMLQALALTGSLLGLGLGPLVIGSGGRSVDHQPAAPDGGHQFARADSGFRTIVGATPAAGVVSRSLAGVVPVGTMPSPVEALRGPALQG
jgi:hypothetical protein